MEAPDVAARRENRRAALCLFLIAAPLAEILSENLPLLTFLKPPTIVFVTLAYGLPVLLIRELAVARRLAVPGILLLGLAYGFLNEGIFAKTLTQPSGQPVGSFAGYGLVGTLQTSWMFMIVPWHALHSVLYPVLITHWLFPQAAQRRWLGGWLLKVMLVGLALCYTVYFLNPVRRDLGTFAFYAVSTALLTWGALQFRNAPETPPAEGRASLKFAMAGAIMFPFIAFQYASPQHFPLAVFFAVTAAFFTLGLAWMLRRGWRPVPEMLLFALGDDLVFATVAAVTCILAHRAPVEAAVAGILFMIIFVRLIIAVRKNPGGRA